MPVLVRSSESNGHSHILYLNESGRGESSVSEKHFHPVILQPPAPAVIDPETGATLAPERGPQWVVGPSEGHTHELTEIMVGAEKEPTSGKTDEEKVTSVQKLFKRAAEYEAKFRKMAEESEGIYNGQGHWTKEQKTDLSSKGRASLTINEIEGKVDTLVGYRSQNKTDTKFFPIEDGDQTVSQLLDILIKNINERNNLPQEKSFVFEDKCVVGRGLYGVSVEYDENPLGDIVIGRLPWGDAFFGPHEKVDASDAEFMIKTKWVSFERLEQMYPDKIEKIKENIQLLQRDLTEGTPNIPDAHIRSYENQYFAGNDPRSVTRDPDFVDFERQQFRVMECWQKIFKRVAVFVNPQDNFVFSSEDWKPGDVKGIESITSFKRINRIVQRMEVTKVAGNVLLDHEFSDLFRKEFPVLPDYAKKRGNLCWGKVEGGKDAQREIDKRHSQTVDIMNKVAAYGWFVYPDTFATPADRDKFTRTSSSPGFVQDITSRNAKPDMVEGVKFPTEIVNLEIMSSQKLDKIMGIPPEMQGFSSNPSMSGVALLEQKRQGLVANEFLFSNSDMAERRLAMMTVSLIQKVYTPERVLRLIENQALRNPQESLNGQPAAQQIQQQRAQLLALIQRELFDNPDLLKYDVQVGESAWTPTTRRANFLVWSQMAQTGMVPPQLLIELSDLPDKERALQMIQGMQQQQQEQELGKQKAEIMKTIIAKRDSGSAAGGM